MFSLLKLEAPCLGRYNDGVWYPASIQHIDEDKHQVTVQYESYGTTATLDVESVLPSGKNKHEHMKSTFAVFCLNFKK